MSILSYGTRRAFVLAAAAVIALAACTEPRRAEQSKTAPSPQPEARIELSDSLAAPGSEIDVTVRVVGARLASMTARLAYDTSGVRFVREEALSDAATRVVNPQPGVIRFAAIAPNGFADGRVYTLRFAVVRSSGLRTFQLSTDEAHSVSQANLVPALTRKP
jgi:cohesin domain-containing protein